ncbi:MAG TPA: amidase family protein [Polyangia bacterium]|jgi:amidase
MSIAEYDTLDGLGLAALVRKRQVSPAELLNEAIARVERVNPRLNAVVTPLYEQARRAVAGPLPDGPFRGVPFLLKDLAVALAGARLTHGSRFVGDYTPANDSTLVARYRQAGLVFFGKTNTPEFGLLPCTEPDRFGPARNPWNPDFTPGGSSGGSAAAVAAGIVPVAHGNDGGGSIRIPASCCGLFGLKPTRGRMPVGPDASELLGGFGVDHVLARSVRDSAAMLDATAGADAVARYHAPRTGGPFTAEVAVAPRRLKIALQRPAHLTIGGGQPLHPESAAALDDAAKLLADLGHDVEETTVPVDAEAFAREFMVIMCVEIAAAVAAISSVRGRRPRRGEVEVNTTLTAMVGRQQSAVRYALARERLNAVARQTVGFFERFDVLLSPTLGAPPLAIGALRPRGLEAWAGELVAATGLSFVLRLPGVAAASAKRIFDFVSFTPLANVTGQPSMSVPLYWTAAGLPIGSMLTAGVGDEATLFQLAGQLEQARPWAARRPPVHGSAETLASLREVSSAA